MKGFDGEKGRRADLRTRDCYPPPPPNNTIEENGIMNVKCPKCEECLPETSWPCDGNTDRRGSRRLCRLDGRGTGGAKVEPPAGSFSGPVGTVTGATVRQQSVMGSVCCR